MIALSHTGLGGCVRTDGRDNSPTKRRCDVCVGVTSGRTQARPGCERVLPCSGIISIRPFCSNSTYQQFIRLRCRSRRSGRSGGAVVILSRAGLVDHILVVQAAEYTDDRRAGCDGGVG